MKIIHCALATAVCFLSFPAFTQIMDTAVMSASETEAAVAESAVENIPAVPAESASVSGKQELHHGPVDVPPAKRPRKPDPEKAKAAAAKDETEGTFKENISAIEYGTPAEINSIIDKIIEEDDPRYGDTLYELFHNSRSNNIKQKILEYFTKQKDPCLEDFAVEILNDPYDEPNAIVEKVFAYVSAVECRECAPAVVDLMESGNEAYFNGALSTLGKIGGPAEAVYLSEYLDREDLTLPQRQALMRTLGEMCAVETWDKLVEIAQDEDENNFVRMYAAESIGKMKKKESIPVLAKLYAEGDPNMRQYCIKGLSNYPDEKDASDIIIQGIRDDHYKVRIESIKAAAALKLKDSVPYLIYRAKNDTENAVKKECYPVIADLDTGGSRDFLIQQLTDKKVSDSVKSQAAEALMKNGKTGEKEILELAMQTLKDDRRKPLRYALGKLFAKYSRPAYSEICAAYIQSKDSATVGLGLDIYRNGRYETARSSVNDVAENEKAGTNRNRARKLLNLSDEDGKKTESSAPSSDDAK